MKAHEIRQLAKEWSEYTTGIKKATAADRKETPEQQRARIKHLETNREEWIAYYFKKYAFAQSPLFHVQSTDRMVAAFQQMKAKGSGKFYQSRIWARGMSKSTRRMMEIFYLMYALKWQVNALLVSKSFDNACRLLAPYRGHMEANQRLIKDYGKQMNIGTWEAGRFTNTGGNSFLAVGRGQSPRGARNEELRINLCIFDDSDDDELVGNKDLVKKAWDWVEKAVIPCVEISKPYMILFDNNLIAEYCLTSLAREKANDKEIINIRDENGKSTWPEKNSEEMIDDMEANMSYESFQTEFMNNPMSAGNSFTEIHWDKCPPLSEVPFAVVYSDPAPSNKDRPGQKSNVTNSRKAVFIIAPKGNKYYIYTGFLDVMGTRIFIASNYACRAYINNQCASYFYIENNTLQDPFYEQVLLPEFYAQGPENGGVLGILPDTRKKPEKWPRIEATLEPLSRTSRLIFNIEEKNNPHMQRLAAQFLAAKPSSKELDGPDAIEGAVFIINQKGVTYEENNVQFQFRSRSESKSY